MSPATTAATFCATLVDEWVCLGIQHAIISPGSRSTPLALALLARPELRVQLFHDERAAGFAALGVGLAGTPAIVLCTSGTAATHFHAAVVEAHQAAVPMIVCTADRPPELRDVGAAQTVDQTRLYGTAVRWFHEPGVATPDVAHTWRAIAARAHAMARATLPGPVHLNLAFREPLLGEPGQLPARVGTAVSSAAVPHDADAVAALSPLLAQRGVIVAGRGSGDPEAVLALAAATGWPVLADARSGMRHLAGHAVAAFDSLLRDSGFAGAHRPEVVLRLGEPPASKVLNTWLAASGGRQVHLCSMPMWIDPDALISTRVITDVSAACRQLAVLATEAAVADPAWLGGWIDAERAAQAALSAAVGDELTEPVVARVVTQTLVAGDQLVVSSSMPVRDVEWFGVLAAGVQVFANRGANGIDGVIATAIGIAVATGRRTSLLIGDVAFLHDSAALIGLVARGLDLRIVVVDNDGGGIFSFLPQGDVLPTAAFETLFGTPHGVRLEALAAAHGLRCEQPATVAELTAALALPGPLMILVRSERSRNVADHAALHAAVAAALRAG